MWRATRPYVDPVGDVASRCPGTIKLRRIKTARCEVQPRRLADSSGDGLARQGGLEVTQRTTCTHLCGRGSRHQMYAHMIGMAIATRGVISHQHLGALRLDQIHQSRDLVVDVVAGEASGLIAREAGVGVPPGLQSRGAEDLGGALQLTRADTGEVAAVLR